MLPTEHSGDKLPTQSTTTTAFGGLEVQHVAESATQDVFSLRPWATMTIWEMCRPQFRARLEN